MKLFFISDLHGCLPTTEFILKKYKESGASHLVILGDVLNHGPRNPLPEGYQPAAVADLLNEYSSEIIAVRGNCDSEVDQMLLKFPMLESYAWVLLENGTRLFLTHGHIYNAENRPPLKFADVIAHGHTHLPLAEKNGEQFIFNPGSITFPKENNVPSYGLLDGRCLRVLSFSDEVIKQVTI